MLITFRMVKFKLVLSFGCKINLLFDLTFLLNIELEFPLHSYVELHINFRFDNLFFEFSFDFEFNISLFRIIVPFTFSIFKVCPLLFGVTLALINIQGGPPRSFNGANATIIDYTARIQYHLLRRIIFHRR